MANTTNISFEQATSNHVEAREQMYELNEQSMKSYENFYDTILAYSAGAFSFGVALIGLVIDDENKLLLQKIFFNFPLIKWLYASMFIYLVTCLLVLISKYCIALYLSAAGKRHYHDTGKIKTEIEVTELKGQLTLREHITTALTENSSEIEDETLETPALIKLKNLEKNITELDGIYKKNKFEENLSWSILKICRIISIILCICATTLLLVFAIQLSQAIIWN